MAGCVKFIQINRGIIEVAELPGSCAKIRSAIKIRIFFFYPSAVVYGQIPPGPKQYSTNFLNAYSIEGRMEQLGRLDRYLRELFRITHANNIPSGCANAARNG